MIQRSKWNKQSRPQATHGWRGLVIALAAAALCVLPAGLTHAAQPQNVTDDGIIQAVDTELILDPEVTARLIDVQSDQGVVTLSGTVDNLLSKERAVKIAETIRGVRSVANRIKVEPPKLADSVLQDHVVNALIRDPAADSYEVKVSVRNGVATLSGTVDSWQERTLAGQVAKGVRGIRDINNEITVKYAANRPDHEIKQEIAQRLKMDVWVDASEINVNVKDGRVTLTGGVGNAHQRSKAAQDAWVGGVTSVDYDGLSVWSWERDPMQRAKPAKPTDAEIEKAIADALLYDPRVFSFNPKVAVDDGVATLSGVVDNLKAKNAARQVALDTVGVVRVRDFLKVRPKTVEDSQLAKDIKEAFAIDPFLEHEAIGVSVYNSKAFLTGAVGSFYTKSRAEDVASRINGVAEVDNNLYVSPPTPPLAAWGGYGTYYGPVYYPRSQPSTVTDAQIKANIEDQYFWSPYVDGSDIIVSVKNGVATLSGQVDSRMERGAAVDNAYQGGAIKVNNELTLAGAP